MAQKVHFNERYIEEKRAYNSKEIVKALQRGLATQILKQFAWHEAHYLTELNAYL